MLAVDAQARALGFLQGGGEMAEVILAHDWSASSLGPPEGWPLALKTAMAICLNSRFPMVVWWGPDLLMLYNDAWRPILGETKHPQGLGRPAAWSWPETWPVVGAQFEAALAGRASWSENLLLASDRRGYLEECYFTYSHSPLRDVEGRIVGVFSAIAETTAQVLGARRARVLGELSARAESLLSQGASVNESRAFLLEGLCADNPDVPFAAFYLVDGQEGVGTLRAVVGLETESRPPDRLNLADEEDRWGIARACRTDQITELNASKIGDLPGGAWPEPTRQVIAIPLEAQAARPWVRGVLVCGVNARIRLDNDYLAFIRVAAAQIGSTLTSVNGQRERRRNEAAAAQLNAFHRKLADLADLNGVLDAFLDAVIDVLEADFGHVQLYDSKTRSLRIAAQRGFQPGLLDHFDAVGADGGSACAQALQSRATVVIEDVNLDTTFAPHRSIAAKCGFQAVISIPVLHGESRAPVGMVSAFFRTPRRLHQLLVDFAELHVRSAANIIVIRQANSRLKVSEARLLEANQSLEDAVAERTGELEAANQQLTRQIEARRQTEMSLRQMQRLEAVGQLTAGVAHDFNNLLMVVLGNVAFLLEEASDPRAVRRLKLARAAAERGARLTGQLLAFSRQQKLEPRPTDLNQLIAEMRDLLLTTAGDSIRLKTKLATDLWPALVDPTQIELVILNLAINARDAMPAGGTLTVETKNANLRRRARKTGAPDPGQYAVIGIRDTGTGMAPEILARAFEPFFTTKSVGRGSGLGLAQAYGFAKQSGGGVTIDTEVGCGSFIRVFLPRTARASKAATESRPKQSREEIGHTVLLVDDDTAVRATVAESLEKLGYRVVEAASGAAALEVIDTGHDIDALVADFGMPGMNGAQLALRARTRNADLPVLFITGYGDYSLLKGVGDGSVLQKPFKAEDLADWLGQAIAEPAGRRAISPAPS